MRVLTGVPHDRWITFLEIREISQETDILTGAVIHVCVEDGDLESRCISGSPWKEIDLDDLEHLEFKKVAKGPGRKKKTTKRPRLRIPDFGQEPLTA